MSFMSKVKGLTLLSIGAAAGATVSYFMDPDRGRSRRAQATDQLGAAARSAVDEARKQADYAAGQAKGAVIESVTPPRHVGDDRTLKAKVESEVLGHVDGVNSGDIVVTAHDGIVGLRGQVASREVADELIRRTRSLPEVRGVEDLLHLPGQPAPNAAAAEAASERAADDATNIGRSPR